MDRRTALRNASLILGYTLTAPAITGIMQGCRPEVIPDFAPSFFGKDQLGMIKAFVDTIIPRTETPSASDVGVVEFLDVILDQVMKPEEQQRFRDGFARLAQLAGDSAFEGLSAREQAQLLEQMEKEALEADGPYNERFWYAAKGLVVNGYMLSEQVGTEHLAYDPIPQAYNGCEDLSISGGKNWSLR